MKKSQCEQEIAEAEADLARMREAFCVRRGTEDRSAAVAGESCSWRKSGAVTSEVPKKQRSTFARTKRRVGGCAEDVLPSTEQDLACWLDDADRTPGWSPPAPSQASSPGGSPRWRVLFHHRPHSRTWCREESDKVGIQGYQSGPTQVLTVSS